MSRQRDLKTGPVVCYASLVLSVLSDFFLSSSVSFLQPSNLKLKDAAMHNVLPEEVNAGEDVTPAVGRGVPHLQRLRRQVRLLAFILSDCSKIQICMQALHRCDQVMGEKLLGFNE